MEYQNSEKQNDAVLKELCKALLLLKNNEEMIRFFSDLCTPQEIRTLAERWRVCRLLNQGDFSYREISAQTGASLATIGRVARFLKDEPHRGYELILNRMHKKKSK
jgi:TrpR-related protein YerC/YecD